MQIDRGTFHITLTDGKVIALRFGYWTLQRFCKLRGNLTFKQLEERFKPDLSEPQDLSLLLLCAAECACLERKEKFEYTEFDACNWIEEIGGIGGETFQEMMLALNKATQGDESKKKMEAV